MGLSAFLGRGIANYLNKPSSGSGSSIPSNPDQLARTLRAGDVLLVEGRFRISSAIKYLTQSTWSHAALCIQRQDPESGEDVLFVEADVAEGIRIVDLNEFAGLSTRICRPIGLSPNDVEKLTDYVRSNIGNRYDLKNVIDLARYLFPTPPVPVRWRRKMIAFGSGEPTKAICSSLIASAFQLIQYPILPEITPQMLDDPKCRDCAKEILHVRHHSLFTPRDFDVSPYFQIVKPSLNEEFNFKALDWLNGYTWDQELNDQTWHVLAITRRA